MSNSKRKTTSTTESMENHDKKDKQPTTVVQIIGRGLGSRFEKCSY